MTKSNSALKGGLAILIVAIIAIGAVVGGFFLHKEIRNKEPVHTHQFEMESMEEPTASQDGWVNYKCSGCGEEKKEVLPKTGDIEDDNAYELIPVVAGESLVGNTYRVPSSENDFILQIGSYPIFLFRNRAVVISPSDIYDWDWVTMAYPLEDIGCFIISSNGYDFINFSNQGEITDLLVLGEVFDEDLQRVVFK